jgi:hypothetical protein
MERSTIQLLAKRGKSQRAIARELGYSRTIVARALTCRWTAHPHHDVVHRTPMPFAGSDATWTASEVETP